MKVLHVNIHLAQKGGVETYLLSLLPLLKERAIEQQVVYSSGEPDLFPGAACVPGIGDVGFKLQKDVSRNMKEVLVKERPDVIHVHNIQNIGVLQACLDYGPTVLTSHDYRTICPASLMFYKRTQVVCQRHCGPGCFTTTLVKHCLTPRPKYASYQYHRTRWIMKHASGFAHVITPSGSVKDRLIRAGFNGDRIKVLPYFCPIAPKLAPRPLPETPTITYIGRVAEYKGYVYFIKALGQLPAHVRGIMVGNFTDSNRNHVMELASQHNCADRVELRPWASREEVLALLQETTVLIFPSILPETLGIVGLEAFSQGVPVVASDIGGVREWLKDKINGRLAQPKADSQIKEGVMDLLASDETLMEFGKRGIDTINEKFLPSQHTNQLIELYEHVVHRN